MECAGSLKRLGPRLCCLLQLPEAHADRGRMLSTTCHRQQSRREEEDPTETNGPGRMRTGSDKFAAAPGVEPPGPKASGPRWLLTLSLIKTQCLGHAVTAVASGYHGDGSEGALIIAESSNSTGAPSITCPKALQHAPHLTGTPPPRKS